MVSSSEQGLSCLGGVPFEDWNHRSSLGNISGLLREFYLNCLGNFMVFVDEIS